jgi:hypothetical protein
MPNSEQPKITATVRNLERYVLDALRGEPFYAAFSRKIPKQFVKGCGTAFVSLNSRGKPYMGIDPEFFELVANTQDRWHFDCQLFHEFLHVMMGHLSQRTPQKGANARRHNVAGTAGNRRSFGDLPP